MKMIIYAKYKGMSIIFRQRCGNWAINIISLQMKISSLLVFITGNEAKLRSCKTNEKAFKIA